MADNESVGKISLDLELTSDLSKQIEQAASKIGDQLKTALQGLGDLSFKGLGDNIGKQMTSSIEDSMKAMQQLIEQNLSKALEAAMANMKAIKIPVEFDMPTNMAMPSQTTGTKIPQPRGPPMPKMSTGVNMEALKAQIDNLGQSLDITNAKIELQQAKLVGLKESYNQTFDESRKNQLQEQILKTEEAINKLTATSNKTGFALADLDDQFSRLSNASKNSGSGITSFMDKLKGITDVAGKVGGSIKNAASSMTDFGNKTNSARNHSYGFFNSMLQWGIIFPMIMNGLTAVGTYISSAFMANVQFADSLNQIKSNLMTAFMPIYQAVLPALNSLMSSLATATAYIASFISQLFGKTYQQSFDSAKAMQSQIGAMDIAGKQAKKAADSLGGVGKAATNSADATTKAAKQVKGALAGFDEINQLNLTVNKAPKAPKVPTPAGSGVITPITPMANMGPIESTTSGWADKFKNILSNLWKPFQQAWATEGQNTINAAKHALTGILDLLGAIGKSFYIVWTNGTGERILVNLLKILQDMLNIIGDIGVTFANAWNKGDIGTQVVQSLANAFNNVLSLIDRMLQAVRTVWGQEGPKFADMFMQALKAGSGVIENITQKLGLIWDNGGQHAFEGLVRLGLKIGELALFIFTNFVTPFVNWFVNMIAPAIVPVLDVIGKLFDKLSGLIDYLMGDGTKYTRDFLILFTGFKVAGFIANIVSSTLSIIANTTAKISNTLATSSNNAANEAGMIAKTKDIGANIQLIALYARDAVVKAASTAATIGRTIATTASTIAQIAHNVAVGAWNVICGIATTVTIAFGAAIAFLTGPIGLTILAITALIAIGILLYKNWDTIKAKATEVWNGITATFNSFKNWLGSVFSTDWSQKFAWMGDILNGFLRNISNIFGGIRQIFWGIIDFIAGVFTGNWSRAWQGVVNIFGGIFNTLYGIAKAPLNGLISLVNAAISGLNQIHVSLPDFMGGGSFGFNIPRIPYLAQGGIVDRPTTAMIGEAGPEAVVPLKNNTGGLNMLASMLSQKISTIQQPQLTMAGSSSGSVSQSKSDFAALKTAIVEAIKEDRQQNNDNVVKLLQIIVDILKNLGMDIDVDGDKLARMVIKQLNRRTRMTGKTELIL
ncbi:hypothetical protein [Clostridium pasteurianum]|uniref:hypothetical protein n=1 Tax=Clostridium pasteurianum TaxID=1501 RepID=UPI0003A57565|nr:hypothetical protein [Clostridium pasteurianum]